MKFLIHSNGPTVKTGYGVQTAHLARRLKRSGHDVAVSVTYGQQGSTGIWNPPEGPVTLYPCGYETNGNDVIHAHAEHFFEGDVLGGWIVPLLDVWCLVNPRLAEFNVAAWAPVDHFPVPPDVLKFFHRTGATPVAMSRFGERLFFEAGLDPVYIPLSVDTTVYKPTPRLTVGDTEVDARTLFGLPHDSFVVGMVGMNKGWARDRKGFNEAFRAFGQFWKRHQNAVLFMHAEKFGGAEGINLVELAQHCAIPEHAIVWSDQYAYRLGLPPEMMAAAYTAMDVLLAPSHGEGFCVPLIEAQACGTPVIASDFSAQTELVGAGWLVTGQPEWDPAQHASYICPSIADIVDKLEQAYAADLPAMSAKAATFAAEYDSDRVYDNYWLPFLATLEPPAPGAAKPLMDEVAVIVPAMRPENLERALCFGYGSAEGHEQIVVFDGESDTAKAIREVGDRLEGHKGIRFVDTGKAITSYAEKVNIGFSESKADWLLIIGDDCEPAPRFLEHARTLSDRFDVIGTNDSEPGRIRNPDVAAGRHADHFFVRRSYIDDEGASLDGPGVLAPEAYRHWYVDKEIIELAKARGVFAPCLDSVVIHHHPGYDGREDLRQADPVYMKAIDSADTDRTTWLSRLPLIQMHRTTRGKAA